MRRQSAHRLEKPVKRCNKVQHYVRSSESGFTFFGKKFRTIEEWYGSPEFETLKELRLMDEIVDDIRKQTDETMKEYYNRELRKFNSCRTWYAVTHMNKEYRDSAKREMNWVTLPPEFNSKHN